MKERINEKILIFVRLQESKRLKVNNNEMTFKMEMKELKNGLKCRKVEM